MSPLPVQAYTTAEVAEAYNISTYTLLRLVKKGKASPMRLSDSPTAELRWTNQDLRDLEQALRPAAPAVPAGRRRRRRAA